MVVHLRGVFIFMTVVRQRATGGFMNESPLDGNVTRRVKLAANTIDKFRFALSLDFSYCISVWRHCR